MDGTINSYQRSLKRTSQSHMIVIADGVDTGEKATALVGKTVVYKTGKTEIRGKVAAVHGRKGAVRVIFEKGMPGQAVGSRVAIN